MTREIRHFEVVCNSCRTLYCIDFKLPPGFYNFHIQVYGTRIIARFESSECPFCTFDEDFELEIKKGEE